MATTVQRLDQLESYLRKIDARLDGLDLNGHLNQLVTLAEMSDALISLAKVAPALATLAASSSALGSLVEDEAVLRDLVDHRTQAKRLSDARDYVSQHDRTTFVLRWRRELQILRWLAPFVAGAVMYRLVFLVNFAPILHPH